MYMPIEICMVSPIQYTYMECRREGKGCMEGYVRLIEGKEACSRVES